MGTIASLWRKIGPIEQPGSCELEELFTREKHNKRKADHPIRFFIWEDIPFWFSVKKHRITEMKWWVYHRFIPKYRKHMINTGLEPSYWDVDTRMLHGCFHMFCEFIDKTDKMERMAINEEEPDRQAAEKEMLALYHWWKVERPIENDRKTDYYQLIDLEIKHKIFEKSDPVALFGKTKDQIMKEDMAWERYLIDIDQEMLIRLVKLREWLWD